VTEVNLAPPPCGCGPPRFDPGEALTIAWVGLWCLAGTFVGGMRGDAMALVGSFAGFAASLLVWGAAIALVDRARRRCDERPRCFSGACGPTDYEALGGLLWRCRCGQTYVQTGDTFARWFDGWQLPYMRRVGGRWVDAGATIEAT
jgi:hypothetical protein